MPDAELLSTFRTKMLARMAGFEARFGKLVTYTGANIGGLKILSAVAWRPGQTLPNYFSDGEMETNRGVLIIARNQFVEPIIPIAAIPDLTDQFSFPGVAEVIYAVADWNRDGVNYFIQGVAIKQTSVGGDHSRIDRG